MNIFTLVFRLNSLITPHTKIWIFAPLTLVCRKAATHDSEIRYLYEEMEAQINNEKDRLLLKVARWDGGRWTVGATIEKTLCSFLLRV